MRTFKKIVEAPTATPAQLRARSTARVALDKQGHVALELRRVAGQVAVIHHSLDGLRVQLVAEAAHDKRFKPDLEYPIDRAALHFAGFASRVGADEAVWQALDALVTLPATTKRTLINVATGEERSPARAAPKRQAPFRQNQSKREGTSAAARFRELILAGGKTDDQIFATVAKEFGLDPSRRGYVQWYRKDLVKKGQLRA